MESRGWSQALGLTSNEVLETLEVIDGESRLLEDGPETPTDVTGADAPPMLTDFDAHRASIDADPDWQERQVRLHNLPWDETAACRNHRSTFLLCGLPESSELHGSAWKTPEGIVLTHFPNQTPGHAEVPYGPGSLIVAAGPQDELIICRRRPKSEAVGPSASAREAGVPAWIAPPSPDALFDEKPIKAAFKAALEASAALPETRDARARGPMQDVVRMGWALEYFVSGLEHSGLAPLVRPARRLQEWWRQIPESWQDTLEEGALRSAKSLTGQVLVTGTSDVRRTPRQAMHLARWRLRLHGAQVILSGVAYAQDPTPTELDEALRKLDVCARELLVDEGLDVLQPTENGPAPGPHPADIFFERERRRAAKQPLETPPWWVPSMN